MNLKKLFFLLALLLTAGMTAGCVVTRFSESLLEYGVTYQRPDPFFVTAGEKLSVRKTKDGTCIFRLPVVVYEQSPEPLYAFGIPGIIPFNFYQSRSGGEQSELFFCLTDRMQPVWDQPVSLTPEEWAAMEPVSGTLQFDEPDDDDSMALPVWKHRSGPGWMVQAFLPIVFCADVAASTVSTVLVDLFLLPGIGLVWCVEESLSHFPEAVPEMEISGQ